MAESSTTSAAQAETEVKLTPEDIQALRDVLNQHAEETSRLKE